MKSIKRRLVCILIAVTAIGANTAFSDEVADAWPTDCTKYVNFAVEVAASYCGAGTGWHQIRLRCVRWINGIGIMNFRYGNLARVGSTSSTHCLHGQLRRARILRWEP